MSDGKEVANQSAMQVQNLKQNLNEWKYVITAADAVINTADPMKTAAAHAGIYTSVYVLFLITNVSSNQPKNRFQPPGWPQFGFLPKFLAKHSYNGFRSPRIRNHSRYFHWQAQ